MSNYYMFLFNIYSLIVAVVNIGLTIANCVSFIKYKFEDISKSEAIKVIALSLIVGVILIAITLYISSVFNIKLDSGISAILALPIAFAIGNGVLLHQEA